MRYQAMSEGTNRVPRYWRTRVRRTPSVAPTTSVHVFQILDVTSQAEISPNLIHPRGYTRKKSLNRGHASLHRPDSSATMMRTPLDGIGHRVEMIEISICENEVGESVELNINILKSADVLINKDPVVAINNRPDCEQPRSSYSFVTRSILKIGIHATQKFTASRAHSVEANTLPFSQSLRLKSPGCSFFKATMSAA